MGTILNLSGVVAIEHQMFNGMVLKGMWCSKQTGFCVPIVLERPCQTCLRILRVCTLPSSCLNCFPFGQERLGRGTVGYSQIPSSEPTECCPDDFKGSTTLRKWQSLKDPNVKILKSRCKKSQLHNLETKGGEYHSDAGGSCRQTLWVSPSNNVKCDIPTTQTYNCCVRQRRLAAKSLIYQLNPVSSAEASAIFFQPGDAEISEVKQSMYCRSHLKRVSYASLKGKDSNIMV